MRILVVILVVAMGPFAAARADGVSDGRLCATIADNPDLAINYPAYP